jgi:hypothetical protein
MNLDAVNQLVHFGCKPAGAAFACFRYFIAKK